MSAAEIALRAGLWWLLLPAVGLPLAVWAQRRGRGRFVARLGVWLAIIPAFLGAASLGAAALSVLLAAAGTVALVEITRLPARTPGPDRGVRLLGAVALAAGLAGWMVLSRRPGGIPYVVVAFSVIAVADITAYACGRLVRSPRLFPRLSPGKTLAGYLGGAACAAGAALILRFALPPHPPLGTVGLGLALAAAGAGGDLLGSALKRRHGVKDFGRALGPQGGMLDRLDSLLPAGWVLLGLIELAGWR